YRLIVESLLGLRIVAGASGTRLVVAPSLPPKWTHCTLQVRYRETLYEIEVVQEGGDEDRRELRLDGALQADDSLPLVDDERLHRVQLTLPSPRRPPSPTDDDVATGAAQDQA
ncbi:MAG: glycosyl hydrolase family 65 protein, partial [Caldimonas sp.]